MKRYLLLSIIFSLLTVLSATAQFTTPGINYQAVARDASGKLMANVPVVVEISFTNPKIGTLNYYSERHELVTDAEGLFQLTISEGASRQGYFEDIPWSTSDVWLKVHITNLAQKGVSITENTQLFSVPYAMYARTVNQLTEAKDLELRNQSIYWTTSGNNATRPPYHYLGTRDNLNLVLQTNVDNTAAADQHSVTFTNTGQLQIKAGKTVRGDDDKIPSYPVTIEGSNQGIHVKVTGSRAAKNNFLTFKDTEKIQGRVEGQTYNELISDPYYIIQAAVFAAEGVKIAIQIPAVVVEAVGLYAAGTGAAASLIFAFAAPGFYGAAVATTAKGIVLGVEAAALLTNSISWAVLQANNVGVSYSSGGADYAEYLLRDPSSSDLFPGEVVGVHGGVVSRSTRSADHVMVVSKRPGFLGNVPAPGTENQYEKIAFLGQVQVQVTGSVAVGDYILPSGKNDGFGVAINPKDMDLEDYDHIIGVAWEAAEMAPINFVNVGIGLSQNELAPRVEEISNKVDRIMDYLEGKAPLHPTEKSNQKLGNPLADTDQLYKKLYSNQEFDLIVDSQASELRQTYTEAAQKLVDQGHDLAAIPGLESFLADPITQLKKMRRNPEYDALWGKYDHYFLAKKKNN
ncbi:MAG: hypothetical protein Sapg2KO_46880 [Saprospiraceae bacterium]